MIWAIAIPKQIKKCLQEVVADISICSNILIHFSRFPTFIYIYIFDFGVAIQVNTGTIISLWPRQPFGGSSLCSFQVVLENPRSSPVTTRNITILQQKSRVILIIEHPWWNPSLILDILDLFFLEVQSGENFIWSGDAQVCSQRYGQGNWSQHQQRSHDRTGTSHAASQKATLEIRDGGWCKKWLRLRHQEPQNGFGIWTLQDFDGFFPNSPAFSQNFPTKKWP